MNDLILCLLIAYILIWFLSVLFMLIKLYKKPEMFKASDIFFYVIFFMFWIVTLPIFYIIINKIIKNELINSITNENDVRNVTDKK